VPAISRLRIAPRRRKDLPAVTPGAPWPLEIRFAEQDLKIEFAVPAIVFRHAEEDEEEDDDDDGGAGATIAFC
jgi:hypothetical protein